MRDSEILQAKMAVRLLSGHKDELEVCQSQKTPEAAVGRHSVDPSPQVTEGQRFQRL
jgi:hypothetical protein